SFFRDPALAAIPTLSLHDALPIFHPTVGLRGARETDPRHARPPRLPLGDLHQGHPGSAGRRLIERRWSDRMPVSYDAWSVTLSAGAAPAAGTARMVPR